jgi:hypothetical protein
MAQVGTNGHFIEVLLVIHRRPTIAPLMPVCLFECWLGLVENETVRDLTPG